jgi:hypothetical protein
MIIRGVRLGLVGAVLVGLGIGAWRVLVPSQEEVIRHQLKEVARLASFNANEGALAKAYNAQKLSSLCAPDVEASVTMSGYRQSISGRDELLGAAMRARSAVTSLQIEFPDILVTIAPDKQSAMADLTARTKVGGEKDYDVREFRCALKKLDGAWLLSRVESVRTLRE